jgi:citrate synthase
VLTGELPQSGYKFDPANEGALRRVWGTLSAEPREAHPMGLLRTAISSAGNVADAARPANYEATFEAEREESLRIVPEVGFVTGLVGRHIENIGFEAPKSGFGYAQNILHLLGKDTDEFSARCMDIALILYTEHEFNAGSFGVRVAAAAHADIYSSAVAGECILKGPRHGSANEESMKLMMDIPSPDKVREYCDNFFAQRGARMPGFGHAVYNLPNSFDPRVNVLRPWVRELSQRKGDMRWYETAIALEEYMAERMKPRVAAGNPNAPSNMDLWTAPLYYLLGIPIPMYTPLFAASRISGWLAHYLETRYVNNEPIIRPRADYVGPETHPYTNSADFGASKW